MAENPLVAETQDKDWHSGAGAVDSAASLTKSLTAKGDDWSGFDATVDGVSFGVDLISTALDPFGALVGAGLGIILEHVPFVSEAWDFLTGDVAQINAYSDTWSNISEELNKIAGDCEAALREVSSWAGDAATAYRTLAVQYANSLTDLAGEAVDAAHAVTLAGMLVATLRGIVFELLAALVQELLLEFAAAMAASTFTFGSAMGVFILWAAGRTASVGLDVSNKLTTLVEKLKEWLDTLGISGKRIAAAVEEVERFFNDDQLRTAAKQGVEVFKNMKSTDALNSGKPDSQTKSDSESETLAPGTGPGGKSAKDQPMAASKSESGGTISGNLDDL